MKRSFMFVALCIALFGCNSKSATNQSATDTTTKLDYPIKHKYSINWKPGDEKNALIVLNCLKKYVAGDVKGCAESFADSVTFIADQFYFKGKRDSLIKIITQMRGD